MAQDYLHCCILHLMPATKLLLREIEGWRRALAQEIAARYPLPERELSGAVNGVLDGIIYLRLRDEKGPTVSSQLAALMKAPNAYARLVELLLSADSQESYGLSCLRSENLVSDELMQGILHRLYRPKAPFHAALTPALLGRIYERSLDMSQNTGPSGQVRRASGIYYTPQPITEYLVRHTVGPALTGRSPRSTQALKILDPACGCGAFLLAALDFLFEWALQWYLAHEPSVWASRKKPPLYKVDEEWRLTVAERARIAQRHIYGVDLDAGAITVAKRALTLKVLEGGAGEVVAIDWSQNLKRGNALVEPDFYIGDDERLAALGQAERERIGAFDWQTEFAAVLQNGGFDVVIGNPPYANHSSRDSQRARYARDGQVAALESFELCRDYCVRKYPHCSLGHHDSYKWFVARALQLTRPGGHFGFILPNTWLSQSRYADVKRCIMQASGDLTIIDLGQGVFPVVVPTCLVVARKGRGRVKRFADLKSESDKDVALQRPRFEPLRQDGSRVGHALVQKFIRKWPARSRVKAVATLREGLHIHRVRLSRQPQEGALPVIDSKNMRRYSFSWEPQLFYANPPGPGAFKPSSGPRIIIRKTGDSLVATLTPETPSFVLQGLYQSTRLADGVAPEYLLGLFNSKFLTFLYQRSEFGQKGRVLAQMRKGHLDVLPVPRLKLSNPAQRASHDTMVELVRRRLQGEVTVEQQIDALVYELYGLSEEEIALVEGE